jgi:hypothetical protein
MDSKENSASAKENSAVEQIVLLIHGIRTQADWQEMVAEVLKEDTKIEVKLIRYGYFDALRFWLPFTRSGPINYVEKQIKIVKSSHPNAKLSIIVHSFGSYIIGKILERHYDLNIEKLILCGSVLETTYRWEDALNRRNIKEDNVINECGKKDIWPVLAKATSWGYGVSGTHGFGNVIVKDRFHDATHGQYFKEEFVSKYWKPFIHQGEYKRTPFEINRSTTPQWLSLLGILPIKSMLMLAVVSYFAITRVISPPPPPPQCIEHFPLITQYETTSTEASLKNVLRGLTEEYENLIALEGNINDRINLEFSDEIMSQDIHNLRIKWNRRINLPIKLCDHLLEIRRSFNESPQNTHRIAIYISCDTILVTNSQEKIPAGYKICL